jgi:TM2 domain-containing membrane protein YozV
METLELQNGEVIRLKIQAQLAKGYPQTAGNLYLTDRRLVLIPNQALSLGFGKRWEIQISDIKSLDTRKPLQGGPYVGSAGKRLDIYIKDNSKHILSFLEDVAPLYNALYEQINSIVPSHNNGNPGGSSGGEQADQPENPNYPPKNTEIVKQPGTINSSDSPKKTINAVLLSLFLAGGAGQIYLGQVKKGIIIIIVVLTTLCIGLGFILWIIGVIDAYLIAKKLESNKSVQQWEFF